MGAASLRPASGRLRRRDPPPARGTPEEAHPDHPLGVPQLCHAGGVLSASRRPLPPPRAYADTYYAPAGASEHQTGLAFDVWDGRHRGDAFARLPQSAWIARNAHTFGFIVRYPKGTQKITGIGWEPWHLRYVGTAVAARFGPNSKMTLEQYLGLA